MPKRKEPPRVLMVSGGRNFSNRPYFTGKMCEFMANHGPFDQILFGNARGTDALALAFAKNQNHDYRVFKTMKEMGKQAGPLRNAAMVQASTHLIAFPTPGSKGTLDAIEQARRKGMEVEVCVPSENPVGVPRGMRSIVHYMRPPPKI